MRLRNYFALVIGSGFSGSLISWILASQNKDVLLIDRGAHPRFAIGESSTPTADFLLAYLAERWSLPSLIPLSSFGTWQRSVPQLRCGLKRGFSYYGHTPHQRFEDDAHHSHSLFVEASRENAWSDTHWHRADVDQYLVQQATLAGVESLEHTLLEDASWNPVTSEWELVLSMRGGGDERREKCSAQWIIDASGNGNASAPFCHHAYDDDWMRTRSGAIYGHWDNVLPMPSSARTAADNASSLGPSPFFDPNDAAQHHVLEDGWVWMLRFLGNRCSVGYVHASGGRSLSETDWSRILDTYPSLREMMADARLVDPVVNKTRTMEQDSNLGLAESSASLASIPRMSRCRNQAAGKRWFLLPVAYGFVDPLHSTGIAHALSGVSRVAEGVLSSRWSDESVASYNDDLRKEIEWIDTIVSGSYRGLPAFELFTGFAMFYFAATIEFEKRLAMDPTHWPNGFLQCRDRRLRHNAETMWNAIPTGPNIESHDIRKYSEVLKQSIAPWNNVGLMDPRLLNRIPHTAPPKRLQWIPEFKDALLKNGDDAGRFADEG